MPRKFLLIAALCICGIVILGSDAFAVTCPAGYTFTCKYVGGKRRCGCFERASTLCIAVMQQANEFCGEGCQAKCEIWGTIGNESTCGDDNDYFDPDCKILVRALCGPKKCEKNPFAKGCWDNVSWDSVHFGKGKVLVSYDDLNCKSGNCKSLLDFFGEDSKEICPPGLVLFDAFAQYFNSKVCFCSEEYDENGVCTGADETCIEAFQFIDRNSEIGDPYTPSELKPVPFELPE